MAEKTPEQRNDLSAKMKSKASSSIWTDEKRAEHSRKIKAGLAARKQAQGK